MIKKSNVLMLSYILFLIVSMVASRVFGWDGIHKTSLAATIAGCFFAFSDLANWYVSYQKLLIERNQEQYSVLKSYGEKLVEKARTQQNDLRNVLNILAPYQDNNSVIGIINTCNKGISIYTGHETDLNNKIGEIENALQKNTRKLNRVKLAYYLELLCSFLGFFVFFSLIAFDAINSFFATFSSDATILAFILIMITYSLKDFFEEREKEKVEKMKKLIDECNEGIRDADEAIKKQEFTEKAKELVEILSKEKENG